MTATIATCQPGTDPGRPVPFTLTPKADALLGTAGTGPGQPIPFTLTAKAHAALDQDGTR